MAELRQMMLLRGCHCKHCCACVLFGETGLWTLLFVT